MPPGSMPPRTDFGASMSAPLGSMPMMPPASMAYMPPASMPPGSMPPVSMCGAGPANSMGPGAQYMPNVSRPQMTHVANPPVVANNMQYGPSYKMQYQKRSTSDKSAVKYTGFLPLEGVYEEDTCRIG
mmetsp:Transcript_40501/g.88321  ORF Transcript_40501/g.88321 Transcript_40501/m.88321 type:complete len:128 (-) Transcript_40501:113-496(-)